MDFGGDLSVLEPSVVFQLMSISTLTGEIKFITPDNVASFYFREGELIYATVDTRRRKLGRFLIEKGWLTEEQLTKVLRESSSHEGRGRIGKILIAKGYLEQDALVSAIQDQMKEVVYEVLGWKSGQFIFFNGVLPGEEDIFLDVKLDHLILEGLQRIDEASRGR